MKFRLHYEGPLYSTQNDPQGMQRDPRAKHKHSIRQKFHPQLKRYWEQSVLDKMPKDGDSDVPGGPHRLVDYLATKFRANNYGFVPFAWDWLDVSCSLHILLLRQSAFGRRSAAGDVDNRLKTLIDALRIPQVGEFGGLPSEPAPEECPFFVLLENDHLVNEISVETDLLLDPPIGNRDDSYVRLIVTVSLKPNVANMYNITWA